MHRLHRALEANFIMVDSLIMERFYPLIYMPFAILPSPVFDTHLTPVRRVTLLGVLRLGRQRLHVPDHLGILINTSITGEKSHSCDRSDGLGQPLLLVLVRLIDELLSINIALEVVGDQVVVSMLDNGIDQSRELTSVTKYTFLDRLEDALKHRVQVKLGIEVGVAQIFHVLGQVTEKKDVVLSDLASDLNICAITRSDDEPAIEDELHVGGASMRQYISAIRAMYRAPHLP